MPGHDSLSPLTRHFPQAHPGPRIPRIFVRIFDCRAVLPKPERAIPTSRIVLLSDETSLMSMVRMPNLRHPEHFRPHTDRLLPRG